MNIKLTAVIQNADKSWRKAKTQETSKVQYFVGSNPGSNKVYFTVDNTDPFRPVLITPKGKYTLVQSEPGVFKANSQVPVTVTLKKITGSIVY